MPRIRQTARKSTSGVPRRELPIRLARRIDHPHAANEHQARTNIKRVKEANIVFDLIDETYIEDVQFDSIHTVKDLYTFVNTARPELANTPYILVRTQRFENGDSEDEEIEDDEDELELIDLTLTLRETGLLNSTITQKRVEKTDNVNPYFLT